MDYQPQRNQMMRLIKGLDIILSDVVQANMNNLHLFKETTNENECRTLCQSIATRP